MKGIITNIQRFCLHDGAGIRTTVFMKGCNLRCKWCHNPETQSFEPQIEYHQDRCLKCGKCVMTCPNKALSFGNRKIEIQRDKCRLCGKCQNICPAVAILISGKEVTVDEVMQEVMEDKEFYGKRGGLTISGGEPMLQLAFINELLQTAKNNGLTTAIDTALCYSQDKLELVLPYVDTFLVDIKLSNSAKHKEYTGVGNEQIISNLKFLNEVNKEVFIRIPVVPEVNDSEIEITNIKNIIKDMRNIKRVDLLPFHQIGSGKYTALDMDYSMANVPQIVESDIANLKEIIEL